MVAPKIVLSNIDTDTIPLMNLDLDGWYLSPLVNNAFDYDCVDLDDFDPEGRYYNEIAELVEDHYVGVVYLKDQVVELAPKYLKEVLDECDIAATVIPETLHWSRDRWSHYDHLLFDLDVDPIWLANKLVEFSKNANFKDSIAVKFPNTVGGAIVPITIDQALGSHVLDQWAIAVLWYIASEHQGLCDDITEEMCDYIDGNPEYHMFSDYEIW